MELEGLLGMMRRAGSFLVIIVCPWNCLWSRNVENVRYEVGKIEYCDAGA